MKISFDAHIFETEDPHYGDYSISEISEPTLGLLNTLYNGKKVRITIEDL